MAGFKKVSPKMRMPEAIARQIEDQIYGGQLLPDEMLPSESALMKEFGVGRNTVREALRMLETSGLVSVRQGSHGGPVIKGFTAEFVSDFLVKAFRLGGISAEAFHEFRLAIEPSIAELIAAKKDLDKNLITRMENNIEQSRKLFDSGVPTAHGNMDFHVLLAEATGNQLFIIVLRTLREGLEMIAPASEEGYRFETIEYHCRILDAIKARDPKSAKILMYEHLVQIREVIRRDGFPNK
jgi:GntR family transcriptional repressor for pyruvate dehydrogenase complex